jgi:S-(hydroxymethyl)glutathione dehydrogenase / alcohol dehydrogenase
MKTLAAILVKTGSDLFIEELEIPKLNYGQVLVKVNFSGLCGTQLSEINGDKGIDNWLPHCLGHEGTGNVMEIGEGVSKVKKDDKVVLSWIKSKGIDAGGAQYKLNNKIVNAGAVTTLQQYAVVSENRLSTQPKELDDISAVLLGCAAPTGMGSIYNILKLNKKSKIIIFGAGGIGLCACLACKNSHPEEILFIEPNKKRRDLAIEFGANRALDPNTKEFLKIFKDELFEKYDFAIEASGKLGCIETSNQVINQQGGKALIIGNAPFGSNLKINPEMFNKGKSIIGTWGGDTVPERDFEKYTSLILKNRNTIKSLLSKPYSLQEINKAIKDFSKGSIGRPIIDMT